MRNLIWMLLLGCSPEIQSVTYPEGFEGCQAGLIKIEKAGGWEHLYAIRCPHSETSSLYSVSQGKGTTRRVQAVVSEESH